MLLDERGNPIVSSPTKAEEAVATEGITDAEQEETTEAQLRPKVEKKPVLITDLNNPILRKPGRPVTAENFEEALECAKKMYEVMANYETRGVSAQQVGYDLNMFVISVEGGPLLAVNPRIQFFKPAKYTEPYYEKCISDPDNVKVVNRVSVIKLFYQDTFMKHQEKRFKGATAALVQHQYDHIRGRLISDHGKELSARDRVVDLNNLVAF